MTVAFIDDGINPNTVSKDIPYQSYVANESGVYENIPDDINSHGTLCYQIFRDAVKPPYRLISIKALDNATGTGSHKALFAALEWCISQDIDLINMSMGTRQYTDFEPIAKRVERLTKPIIVAACCNQNELTFPACLPQVIGVRHCGNEALRGKLSYLSNPYDQIEVMTHASVPANSCAAPVVSAYIYHYLSQGIRGIKEIRQNLAADSVRGTSFADYEFYKGLLHTWEDVNIPVVLLTEKMKEVISLFIADGYRALGLSLYNKTQVRDMVFNLRWNGAGKPSLPQLIRLYHNFALPDILFLHMDINEATALPEEMKPEIINFADDAKALYDKILKLF